VVVGGQQFYERKEVKDAVAYLRVIDNPGDEASLVRIMNFPRRGIGDTTMVRLNQWSLEHNVGLFETMGRVAEIPGIAESSKKPVTAFHTMMKEIIAGFGRVNMGAQVNALFNRLRIEDELYRTLNDASQARKRIENIEQVVNSLALFEAQTPRATLSAFLERISLMDEEKTDDDKGQANNNVTLMSLHSSKGLEFNHVYLVGMEEELLPHKRSVEEDPACAEERRRGAAALLRRHHPRPAAPDHLPLPDPPEIRHGGRAQAEPLSGRNTGTPADRRLGRRERGRIGRKGGPGGGLLRQDAGGVRQ
jgi:superfamily I DNA/RNA helicase